MFRALCALTAAALVVPAAATAQVTPVIQGEVNAATADEFVRLIQDNVDRAIGLDITAPALDGADLITRPEDAPDGSMSITADGDEGRVEVSGDAAWDGAWRLNGVFTVEYVTMGQGIMAYHLRPEPGATATRPVPHVLGQ